jgi:hypothetical protein
MLFSKKNISLSKNIYLLGSINANASLMRKISGRKNLPGFPPGETEML